MLDEIKQYIPAAARHRIADGQDGRLAEMLRISVVFASIKGVDLHAANTADMPRVMKTAQRLMLRVQESTYRNEGSVNKVHFPSMPFPRGPLSRAAHSHVSSLCAQGP